MSEPMMHLVHYACPFIDMENNGKATAFCGAETYWVPDGDKCPDCLKIEAADYESAVCPMCGFETGTYIITEEPS